MRRIVSPSALLACLVLAGCGGSPSEVTIRQNSNSATNTAQTGGGQNSADASNVGVVCSHGGPGNAAVGGAATSDKAPVATPELDAKIEKAVAKAKASGAGESDKKAAAKAYFNRADYYREQGTPALYKFALADYRRGLRLDPADEDARAKMDEIVSIYQSMNRPVPELGKEQ